MIATTESTEAQRKTRDVYPELTRAIIGAAIEVHRYWGPGLTESIYEKSLARELELRNLKYQRQLALPLVYKDVSVGEDLRLDLWVESKVVVEFKSIAQVLPVHESQLLTYMRLSNSPVGLLVNFNVNRLKDGITRRVL